MAACAVNEIRKTFPDLDGGHRGNHIDARYTRASLDIREPLSGTEMASSLTNLVDALALLGNVNLNLNQRRHDEQIGDINTYKGLCNFDMDCIHHKTYATHVKDIAEANTVVATTVLESFGGPTRCALNVYGVDSVIGKEDCINRITKKLGTDLRKLSTQSKKKGFTLGGRGWGKPTHPAIVKLTAYYRVVIRAQPERHD